MNPAFLKDGKLVQRFNGAVARGRCPCPDVAAPGNTFATNCECAECSGLGSASLTITLWFDGKIITDPFDFQVTAYGAFAYTTNAPNQYNRQSGVQGAFGLGAGAISPAPCGFSTPPFPGALLPGDAHFAARTGSRKNGDGNCQWFFKLKSVPSNTVFFQWYNDSGDYGCADGALLFSGALGSRAVLALVIR